MTSPPPLSEIIRTLEQIAGRSCDLLTQALDLIQQAAASEKVIVETATKAVGPERSGTVVDLVRMTVAGRIAETVESIHMEIAPMRPASADAGRSGSAPVAVGVASPSTVSAQRPPDVRLELYGVDIPSGRKADADDVVAAAKSAAAQNKKTNPFEHHRGKNSWKKSLFVAALAHLMSDDRERRTDDEAQDQSAVAASPPAGTAVPQPAFDVLQPRQEQRPSVARAGPLRGVSPAGRVTAAPPQSGPAPATFPASSGRPHGQGVAVQKISGEQVVDGQSLPPRPSNPFFKRTGR